MPATSFLNLFKLTENKKAQELNGFDGKGFI